MKQIIFSILAALVFTQAQAERLFSMDSLIGCGTVTSVRNVDQEPLWSLDMALYSQENGHDKTYSGGTAAQLAGSGLVGIGKGLAIMAGSVAVDAVANSREQPVEPVVVNLPGERFGKKVYAVGIAMDDGRTLNIPLIEARRPFIGRDYRVGYRLQVAYNSALKNIQVALAPNSFVEPPLKGASNYESKCALRADKSDADWIMSVSEFLVDESKILP